MIRVTAACLAACLLLESLVPAAPAHAQAAAPFPVVPIEAPARRSHTWAYVTMAGGAGLIGMSFAFARRADEAYDAYLVSTDALVIDRLYDRAVRDDHLSQASVLCGEALLAVGLYVRFIRRPAGPRLSLALEPSRCALSFRF